jgi:hypothetical protein
MRVRNDVSVKMGDNASEKWCKCKHGRNYFSSLAEEGAGANERHGRKLQSLVERLHKTQRYILYINANDIFNTWFFRDCTVIDTTHVDKTQTQSNLSSEPNRDNGKQKTSMALLNCQNENHENANLSISVTVIN